MKRVLYAMSFICSLLLISHPTDSIGGERPDNYTVIKIGQYSPAGDLDDLGFDNKIVLGINYGRYINKNLVLEGGLEVFGSDYEEGLVNIYFTGFATPILTAKGVFPKERFEFYGGGGFGLYQTKYDYNYLSTEIDENDTVFGYHILVGLGFDVTPYWYLGLEVKQLWTGESDFKIEKTDADGRFTTLNLGLRW